MSLAHSEGSVHYHAVVKLCRSIRFLQAKRTLRERDGLPSHWSCSHTRVWSAMRYLHIGTPSKPEVDTTPWCWESKGNKLDLFELSQEPFMAEVWRKRREADAKKESVETKAPKRSKGVTKLDMAALVLSKQLHTKDKLMAYVQEHGTAAMQTYTHKNQRRLAQDIVDALEWSQAKDSAALEALTDWELLTRCASNGCPHQPGSCTYRIATAGIFENNQQTINRAELAASLRDIVVSGPSKTTRVPFLVGPSNSGKSTIVYPFDDLFSLSRVHHKPALGSGFSLRNLVDSGKRFIFWDEFQPVAYASDKTLPVPLFLSLFIGKHTEIQVSQAFNDGNKDIQWNRGAVFTAKLEGLWLPSRQVSAEDIVHIRNRVKEFVFTHPMQQSGLKEVCPCAPCMCQWIIQGARSWDTACGVSSVPQGPSSSTVLSSSIVPRVHAIQGLSDCLGALQAPPATCKALLEDLEQLGAVRVAELTAADWESLSAWGMLLPLQRRRLLHCAGCHGA